MLVCTIVGISVGGILRDIYARYKDLKKDLMWLHYGYVLLGLPATIRHSDSGQILQGYYEKFNIEGE